MSLMFLLGFCSVFSIRNSSKRMNCGKVFGVVFSVYVISAFIASRAFLNGQSFYVDDPLKYIDLYSKVNSWSWESSFTVLTDTYLFFKDNNGLFNEALKYWGYLGNHFFDGSSVFYMTLFQTLFGVLASLEIYKIFSLYFDAAKANKYACTFALLSLFHIYSIVIIRDIVIAFFYMLGLRRVIGQPRFKDIFVLLFVMIVTMGVRLYTGLFFGAFIMLWLYKLLQDKKYSNLKILLVPIIVVGIAFVGISFASSILIDSAAGQLEEYDDLYTDVSGASARLRSLPMGIRQVVILFFSQLPLESFQYFIASKSLSNYYLSILAVIYQIFGFVIFYGLMYYCFIKGYFKKMGFNEKWILIIMVVFIALNLSIHMDVRRSMEAIPFIYLFYLLALEHYPRAMIRKINSALVVSGIMMMLAYTIIK